MRAGCARVGARRRPPTGRIRAWDPLALARALRAALPAGEAAWLAARPLLWREGRLLAVHAGPDPRRPPERQGEGPLLWGHRDFGRRARADGLWVVHGHWIVPEPALRPARPPPVGAAGAGRRAHRAGHGRLRHRPPHRRLDGRAPMRTARPGRTARTRTGSGRAWRSWRRGGPPDPPTRPRSRAAAAPPRAPSSRPGPSPARRRWRRRRRSCRGGA